MQGQSYHLYRANGVIPARIQQLAFNLGGEAPFVALRELLLHAVESGLASWLRMGNCDPETFACLSKQARARIIQDVARETAEQGLASVPDTRVVKQDDSFFIVYQEKYIIRIAKIASDLTARHNRTLRSRDFYSVQLQQSFASIIPNFLPEMIPVIFGYQLDATETVISDVFFVIQYKDEAVWNNNGEASEVPSAWSRPVDAPKETSAKRVRTKISAKPVKPGLDAIDEGHEETK